MAKNIFLFSGQGSQYVGMAKELYDKYPAAKSVFDAADSILGYDIADICFNGPDAELNKTINSQPAIMACSLAAFEAAKAEGISFDGVAGHSLGEYAAMVASGMISTEDGFKLIKARAAAMQKAAEENDGAMYAIIGLDAAEVEKICEETEGYVVPVNYNSAVQTVIAGETAVCEAAAAKFAEMKKKAIRLNVASAFHSKLMQSAADEFIKTAETVSFGSPQVEFYSNVTGGRLEDFSDMPALLAKHIVSPVKFTSELAAMDKTGYENYIELGPSKVLTGLVKKTLKGANAVNIENSASLEKALASL
ncbi:ACP S-malonyltransferase [Ruminococcus sp. Marseille-P6503]|uniref:ACP S-malonyltransferase n=1 Tax=Ruminococcus sp. Marseille-P6503 TaxID=2364796 RepID=UPI000F5465F1|nr:ACP S-malonyltransferase [Ruminococcus sp. Marseille-P6503]